MAESSNAVDLPKGDESKATAYAELLTEDLKAPGHPTYNLCLVYLALLSRLRLAEAVIEAADHALKDGGPDAIHFYETAKDAYDAAVAQTTDIVDATDIAVDEAAERRRRDKDLY